MLNLLLMAPAIADTSSFSTATGDGRIGRIDARDVAAVAAEIAASPAAHAGKTYWPTGPEVLSGAQVAAVLSKVLGRPIAFHPITFEDQRQAMINVGLPETVAEDNAKAVAMMAEGDRDYVTNDALAAGALARTFERFATGRGVLVKHHRLPDQFGAFVANRDNPVRARPLALGAALHLHEVLFATHA
jgi:uncharacterized protein YbjT (DUF2867 family)